MRINNLKSDFEDPFGSMIFKKLDDLETKTLTFNQKTRLDLIPEMNLDYLIYNIIINRFSEELHVKSLELINDIPELKSIEMKNKSR